MKTYQWKLTTEFSNIAQMFQWSGWKKEFKKSAGVVVHTCSPGYVQAEVGGVLESMRWKPVRLCVGKTKTPKFFNYGVSSESLFSTRVWIGYIFWAFDNLWYFYAPFIHEN
jgi:hypothetical protein